MNMTKHFLPDYHHWGDPTLFLEDLIKVPIRRVPQVAQWTGDPPFLIIACTWHHKNSQGPLTEEKFKADLKGAYKDLAKELNCYGTFLAYPITYKPPTVMGVAYHDWVGAIYPFDIRAVITLDESIPSGQDGKGVDVVEAGLTFNLITLIGSEAKRGS